MVFKEAMETINLRFQGEDDAVLRRLFTQVKGFLKIQQCHVFISNLNRFSTVYLCSGGRFYAIVQDKGNEDLPVQVHCFPMTELSSWNLGCKEVNLEDGKVLKANATMRLHLEFDKGEVNMIASEIGAITALYQMIQEDLRLF